MTRLKFRPSNFLFNDIFNLSFRNASKLGYD